jgi:hypothetical protein
MITRVLPESFAWFRRARSSLLRFPAFPDRDAAPDSVTLLEPLASAADGNTVVNDSMRHASRRTFICRLTSQTQSRRNFVAFSRIRVGGLLVRRQAETGCGRDRYCDLCFFGLFLRLTRAASRSAVNVGLTSATAGTPSALCDDETW